MAIVKMKRLRLIALLADREELLNRLQRLGCVEVDEPENADGDPAWAALARPADGALQQSRARLDRVNSAMDVIKQYGPKQGGLKPRPEVSQARFFDDKTYAAAEETADQLCGLQREITALEAERAKMESQRASLAPWLELNVPLETVSTASTTALFGTLPADADLNEVWAALGEAAELCAITPAGQDREFQSLFFLCHNSVAQKALDVLQEKGFSRGGPKGFTGTAAENDRRLAEALEDNARRTGELKARAAGYAGSLQDLWQCADRAGQEVRREEAKERLRDTGETFYLTGWFPAEDEAALKTLLDGYACAWESEEPAKEEYPEVPVKLKNNWFTGPLSMVTEMYSLPAYGSLDPNPLMAPFFVLFYGMMLADMGYGLLMVIISVVVMKKLKPKGPTTRYMFPLLGLCGVSTFFWGALTGGFFGDFIPQILKLVNPASTFTMPALFSPLDDALSVLLGSLALGLVQIFTGMAINIYKKIKRGEVMDAVCEEVAWYAVFFCIGIGALTSKWKYALLAALAILVLTQGYGRKGILGKLMGIGSSLYNNITGYFSDILSYSRLMALMLAGAVIAQVFNTLGVITGNIFSFLLISIIGNALNFALNLLGCFVHDMRLQCLEYFSRFYEDGGRPFQPLNIETKFVNIGKE